MRPTLLATFSLALCFICSPASATWIKAKHFESGEDVSNVAKGVTFGWLKHEIYSATIDYFPSIIGTGPVYSGTNASFQYFGRGLSNSEYPYDYVDTYTLDDAGYAMHLENPEEMPLDQMTEFEAFTATFSSPTRTFGFYVENDSSDGIDIMLFDPQGNFIRQEEFSLPLLNPYCGANEVGPCAGLKMKFIFDTDVGSIILGGESAATRISEVFVSVPEPSTLSLIAIGMAGLGLFRRKH